MKVVEVIKPGELEISEKPMPSSPKAGEVMVKIKAAGLCGSDIHIYHGKNAFATFPRVIGHEVTGEVSQVGENVEKLKVGDRVAVDNVISCGKCYACRMNRPNVCKDLKVLGVHVDGGFCEYMNISAENTYKLPDSISYEMAATIEPYSIAAEASDRGRLTSTDDVLICGAGPLGLMLVEVAKSVGARVAIMDVVDARLEKALECGADMIINPKNMDVTKSIMEFTDGEGANLIFEATGNLGVFELTIAELVSQAGRVIVLGFPNEHAKVKPSDIMKRELDILGSRVNNKKFPQVIEWMDKKQVDPSKIISHTFSFEDIAEAMKLYEEKPNEVYKIVLTF